MPYWVLGEERWGDNIVLRKLATAPDRDSAEMIFNAISDAGAYQKLVLVEVLREV